MSNDAAEAFPPNSVSKGLFQDLCDLAGEIETACRGGDAQRAHDLARRVQQAAGAVLETAAAYRLSEDECDGGKLGDSGT